VPRLHPTSPIRRIDLNTKHTPLSAALSALLATLPAGLCGAQAGDVSIYKGETPSQVGIVLSSWGSGDARESEDFAYVGNKSIKVITHGRYQGARLVLNKPVDLKAAATDPNAYLQFVYMMGTAATGGAGGAAGDLGGPYSGGAGRLGGRGGPGGSGGPPGGAGAYGGDGGGGGATVKTVKAKPLANFRIVLVTADNRKMEFTLPVDSARLEREEWRSVAIPVASIPGIKESAGQLKEIHLFGDSYGTLYLGEVRVVRDATPIRPDDLSDQTVAKNDVVVFTASAEGGPAPLKYEWTIVGVPSKDPNERSEVNASYQVVGEGRVFKHAFRKSGDYMVTLTVSDLYGLKKAATTKANIHVTL
jgi:hypothetical protein